MLKGSRCFAPKCADDKRNKPPGQQIGRSRRVSDRGLQLREKQKPRYAYGLMERQFRRLFTQAERLADIIDMDLVINPRFPHGFQTVGDDRFAEELDNVLVLDAAAAAPRRNDA